MKTRIDTAHIYHICNRAVHYLFGDYNIKTRIDTADIILVRQEKIIAKDP